MTKLVSQGKCPNDLHDWALNHWYLVDRLAQRRFQKVELAEEASLFVMEQCCADDWHRLRKFTGKAKFSTYFCSVAYRLLEDFARKRFGRMRPPAWLGRLGGIWLYLFRLLCLERFSPHEAVQMAARYRTERAVERERIAEKILEEIPSCGKAGGREEVFSEDSATFCEDDCFSPQHGQLEEEERLRLLAALAHVVFGDGANTIETAQLEALSGVKLQLSPRERLLLKLCHRDGLSVSRAGRMLGLNRFQAHGQLRRLYRRIEGELTAAGVAGELLQLLGD